MARFKHGDKRTWELAVDAIRELGGSAPSRDILARIRRSTPNYVISNLLADLSAVSVNSRSRGQYSQNQRPRRTDSGSEFDRLFKRGERVGVTYELYDPRRHGIWEIYLDGAGKAQVRQMEADPVEQALSAAAAEATTSGRFDPGSIADARERVIAAIVRRRGQPAFRDTLLEAYGGRCAVTGCTVADVLEAAHIHPYRGEQTNVVANGLLLRSDVHALFDLGLLRFDPALKVVLSARLSDSEYEHFRGSPLRLPSRASDHPSREALAWHADQFRNR